MKSLMQDDYGPRKRIVDDYMSKVPPTFRGIFEVAKARQNSLLEP